MRASTSSPYTTGLPARGRSSKPATPSSAKRVRHLLTVAGRSPKRRAIALVPSPFAAASTIFARSTNRCSVVDARSQPDSVSSPSAVNTTTVASRIAPP